MLIPTSNILLQFGEKKKKNSNPKKPITTTTNINTIKIDFRKMAHLPSVDAPFTYCEFCQGIVVDKTR